MPRMYMKRFSNVNGNPKGKVNVFLVETNQPCGLVPYKNQCKKRYYYGKNGAAELYLSKRENTWDKVIQKAIDNDVLTINEKEELRNFVIFQLYRTPIWLDTTKKHICAIRDWSRRNIQCDIETYNNYVYPIYIKPFDFLLETLTPELYVENSLEECRRNSDLSIAIVTCDTDVELVTSDSPVLAFNPFAWGIPYLDAMGIILLCPLDPHHFVIIYDSNFYTIQKNDDDYITLTNSSEIQLINAYQYIMSDKIVISHSHFDLTDYPSSLQDIRLIVQARRQLSGISAEDIFNDIYNEVPSIRYLFPTSVPLYTTKRMFRRVKEPYRTVFKRIRPGSVSDEKTIRQTILEGKEDVLKKLPCFRNKTSIKSLNHQEKMNLKLLAKAFKEYWEDQDGEPLS